MISRLIPYVCYQGGISLCGNVGGIKLDITVLPFILRGIKLLGIDSVNIPIQQKEIIWDKLSNNWDVSNSLIVDEIDMERLPFVLDLIEKGHHIGRTIVEISKL